MKDETYVILNWERDWDDDNIYFLVTIDGTIIKYNILTEEVWEYEIERVVQ